MNAYSFCHFCGTQYQADAWPRKCSECSGEVYQNPFPVSVIVAHYQDRVVAIRRGIAPVGLALPGGFMELGESWQEGGAREFKEETGININPANVAHLRTVSTPNGRQVLIFGEYRLSDEEWSEVNLDGDGQETSGVELVAMGTELVFPLHSEAIAV